MKGHTTLWDAIEELRRSVREKCGVELVHLHSDSDPNLRVDGSTDKTKDSSDPLLGCSLGSTPRPALDTACELWAKSLSVRQRSACYRTNGTAGMPLHDT